MFASKSKVEIRCFAIANAILFVCFAGSCSVPSFQSEACAEARTAVREFYSFHFGNDMAFSQETLKRRDRFLTEDLYDRFGKVPDGIDPFTTGDSDPPRAFRVGRCTELNEDRQSFDVLLFWRDDTSTEQKTIIVTAERSEGSWKIDDIQIPWQK